MTCYSALQFSKPEPFKDFLALKLFIVESVDLEIRSVTALFNEATLELAFNGFGARYAATQPYIQPDDTTTTVDIP